LSNNASAAFIIPPLPCFPKSEEVICENQVVLLAAYRCGYNIAFQVLLLPWAKADIVT